MEQAVADARRTKPKPLCATARRELLLVEATYPLSASQSCLEVECQDYDTYAKLPKVISFKRELYGKTGWNSDVKRCYYKTGIDIAQEEQL